MKDNLLIKKREMMERQDGSKRLVVILLIITILVSILGTWTILSALNTATVYKDSDVITGKVSVTIASRPMKESTLEEDDNK